MAHGHVASFNASLHKWSWIGTRRATLGLHSEHDSISAYIKKVVASLSMRNTFLSSFRKHVKAIEAGECENDRVTSSWAAQLKEEHEEAIETDSKSAGFKANKQFIETQHWKPEYGTYTKEQVVTHYVFGQPRKGIFRNVNPEGHWDYQETEEKKSEN